VNGRARGMVTLYTYLTHHLVPACRTHIRPEPHFLSCMPVWCASLHSSCARVGRNVFCNSSTLIDIATSREGNPIQYFRTLLRGYCVNTIFRQRSINPSQSSLSGQISGEPLRARRDHSNIDTLYIASEHLLS
jgi:hypothetical protein